MVRRIDDFLKTYQTLMDGTGRVFDMLTDENLNQTVTDGHRSLGQIAWHIVATIAEMMGRTGLRITSIDHGSPPPASASAIVSGYRATSTELIDAIRTNWDDDSLLQTDDMYGERWPRGLTLAALVHHEIHHRAQMTVLLRQSGQRVPGVFGPSKEEWTQYEMQPPAY